MINNTTTNSVTSRIVTRAILSACNNMTPIDTEKRARFLEFREWFVESAGTDDDPYGPDDGLTKDPEDRRTIVSLISDVVGLHHEKYCGDRDALARAIEETIYSDPKYHCELATNVRRDVLINGVVRRYLYALDGPEH